MYDSLSSVITIIAVTAVFIFYFFIKKKESKDWVYAVYFITIIITGTIIHWLGLSYKQDNDTSFSPLFVFAKSLGTALRTLGGDFNAANVSELAKDNRTYAIAAFIQYIATMILTFIIVIKIFGKNAVNRVMVFINSFRSKYIIVGLSDQTELFLKSFNEQKRRMVTIVLEAKHKEKKHDLMFKGFAVVVIKEEKNFIDDTKDALRIAGFQKNSNPTHIIAMSDNDEFNLLIAKLVTDYIKEIIKPERNENGRINKLTAEQENKLENIKLFAHIMYETLDRTEHFSFADYALGRVKFFNPYEVRARKFMNENPLTSLIPKAWINTEKARLFNSKDTGHDKNYRIGNIFIGYGNTNKYILKKSICNNQLLNTDYNALIIDKNAKILERQFQNSAPGLFHTKDKNGKDVYGSELKPNPDGTVYYPNPHENYNISFAELNVLSYDFYARIIQEIEGTENRTGLDFVTIIISLETDKLSIETAMELRQKLYERRLLKGKTCEKEYDRVRIFVKILKDSVLSEYDILNDINDIDSPIIVFGVTDEVLNEDYIIQEKLDNLAKRIANNYWETTNTQKTNIVTKWDELTEFKRDSNRYAAMAIRTKLNLLGFDLIEDAGETTQDIITAYEKAYNIEASNRLRTEKENGIFTDLVERDEQNNIIDNARNNLARLEHQRWNTIHLINGWTKLAIAEVNTNVRQDEKAKQHACITTFEGLAELCKKQAEDAVAKAKMKGENLSMDKALSDADTVCYDFDVMDRLFVNLNGSGFVVVKTT